jgi:hypothetical protein
LGLILSRAQIRALLCSSKSKFIPAHALTLLVLDKKNSLSINPGLDFAENRSVLKHINLVK